MLLTGSNRLVVANVILVPSERETVPADAQPAGETGAVVLSEAEPPPMVTSAGRCANRASRSIASDPDQDEIVAPATRSGCVFWRSEDAYGGSAFDGLVLLIFRIADSVAFRQRRDAFADPFSSAGR